MAVAFNPFHVFRKYQKTALAAITLLSMFAFVCVGPSLMGRGSMGDGNGRIPVIAKWNYGEILRSDVENRLAWRVRINKFLTAIYERAKDLKQVDPESGPRLFNPATEDGVLTTIVLEKKAELMGMTISDKSINDYIDAVTNGTLSKEDKEKAMLQAVGEGRGSAGQLSDQLFEALRFELLARNFATLLMHDAVDYDTPEQRWDYFSRLGRAATVQVLPVAVKDFVDKIPDPPEGELQALFDQYKDVQSREDLPNPGFKVPPRGKFGYFKAVRATLAKADEPKITDAEINDFYAAHKENFRKSTFDEAFPSTEKPKAEEKPKSEEKPKAEEKPRAETNPKSEEKPKVETKPAKDVTKPDDKSKPDEKAKSDDKTKPADKPANDDKTKADDKTKVDDKAKPAAKPADDQSSSSRAVPRHFGDDELLALADPETPPSTPPADTKSSDTTPTAKDAPTTNKTETDKANPSKTAPPKAETPKTETPKTETPKTETPKAEQPKKEAPKEAPKAEPAKNEPAKNPPAETEPSKVAPAKTTNAPAVEFDPVTDPKVRSQIRTTLANQKASKEIADSFDKLKNEVQKFRGSLSEWRAGGSHEADKPEAPDFAALAKSFGVAFEQTNVVSAEEARDTTELGKSTKIDEIHFRLEPFAQLAFDPNMPDYTPSESDSPDGEVSYLWWRTQFVPPYVPAFADAKPQVLHAWKMIEARKLALKQAEDYAADANKRQASLKEIFQNRANMTVSTVGPFHWLSVANVPFGNSMQQIPQVTQVSGLDMAEVEFMHTVFTTDVGSTGVAFNQPRTIAYVVQVQKIDPPEDIFRQQFQTYQTEHGQNWGIAGLAADINAEQVVKPADLMAIEKEMGYQRLAPASSDQGSSSAPEPAEGDD